MPVACVAGLSFSCVKTPAKLGTVRLLEPMHRKRLCARPTLCKRKATLLASNGCLGSAVPVRGVRKRPSTSCTAPNRPQTAATRKSAVRVGARLRGQRQCGVSQREFGSARPPTATAAAEPTANVGSPLQTGCSRSGSSGERQLVRDQPLGRGREVHRLSLVSGPAHVHSVCPPGTRGCFAPFGPSRLTGPRSRLPTSASRGFAGARAVQHR